MKHTEIAAIGPFFYGIYEASSSDSPTNGLEMALKKQTKGSKLNTGDALGLEMRVRRTFLLYYFYFSLQIRPIWGRSGTEFNRDQGKSEDVTKGAGVSLVGEGGGRGRATKNT